MGTQITKLLCAFCVHQKFCNRMKDGVQGAMFAANTIDKSLV